MAHSTNNIKLISWRVTGFMRCAADEFCQSVEGACELFMCVLQSAISTGRNSIYYYIIPTCISLMQNKHDMEFQIFHPLADEFAVKSWLKIISQAYVSSSPLCNRRDKYSSLHFPPEHAMVNVVSTCAPRWSNQLEPQGGKKLKKWGFRKGSIHLHR